MDSPGFRLVAPTTPELIDAARDIFREYAASLGVDLCFQRFDEELATLPGEYVEPQGLLLLALVDDEVAACGAFRSCAEADYANACEMKRLYVRRAYRRLGLGSRLARTLMERAAEAGYSAMLLDTLDEMEAARELYVGLGFEEIPPYYYNPIPGAHYLKAELSDVGRATGH